ncbi:reverse transcriptase [Perkinsela sp. CCAP 1560/4]|nr:reverse transcriptase [Perkinsela sp. CCAP 1560/4]|eukprot:KNH08682.1 reverse transcriptase [Perkinsela sp. CCAP 1560/4]
MNFGPMGPTLPKLPRLPEQRFSLPKESRATQQFPSVVRDALVFAPSAWLSMPASIESSQTEPSTVVSVSWSPPTVSHYLRLCGATQHGRRTPLLQSASRC